MGLHKNEQRQDWDTESYIHQCTKRYVDVHSMSVSQFHFYAIPILYFKFPKFLFTCGISAVKTLPTYSCSELT